MKWLVLVLGFVFLFGCHEGMSVVEAEECKSLVRETRRAEKRRENVERIAEVVAKERFGNSIYGVACFIDREGLVITDYSAPSPEKKTYRPCIVFTDDKTIPLQCNTKGCD
jgi:hypothetical protein